MVFEDEKTITQIIQLPMCSSESIIKWQPPVPSLVFKTYCSSLLSTKCSIKVQLLRITFLLERELHIKFPSLSCSKQCNCPALRIKALSREFMESKCVLFFNWGISVFPKWTLGDTSLCKSPNQWPDSSWAPIMWPSWIFRHTPGLWNWLQNKTVQLCLN